MFDDLTCINCTQKLIPRRFGLERFHCIHENDLNANNFSEIIKKSCVQLQCQIPLNSCQYRCLFPVEINFASKLNEIHHFMHLD
jgi:hypothetical protein